MNNKKDIHIDCHWRIADDGPPDNPLQALAMSICNSPKDFSKNKFDAYLYGVIVGWEDSAYEQLKKEIGWTDSQIEYQKILHQNIIKAWNLLTENNIK